MALTYVTGNDGLCTLPTAHTMNVKTWAANLSYFVSDQTGFSMTGKYRRLGIVDISGSLGGNPTYGSAGTPFGTVSASNLPTQNGGTLVLGFAAASTASLTFDVVFSSIALNADKSGDATLTLNFEMSDTNGASVVWATS